MKKIYFLILTVVIFLIGVVPAFAVSSADFRSFVSSNFITESVINNVNNGYYIIKYYGIESSGVFGRIYIPRTQLNGYVEYDSRGFVLNNEVVHSINNQYAYVDLLKDGTFRAGSSFTTNPILPTDVDYWEESKIMIAGRTALGGLGSFLANMPPKPIVVDMYQIHQTEAGHLTNRFGSQLQILLPVGIAIFSTLLVVPLVPRLVRSLSQ